MGPPTGPIKALELVCDTFVPRLIDAASLNIYDTAGNLFLVNKVLILNYSRVYLYDTQKALGQGEILH